MKEVSPITVCRDGTRISVQASRFHYCTPKNDEGPYTHVEVGFPSVRPSWWDQYAEDPTTLQTLAAYVPSALVHQFIKSHGGVDDRAPEIVEDLVEFLTQESFWNQEEMS